MAKKRVDKSKSAGEHPGHRRFWRYVCVLLLMGVVTLAWLSLASFSPTDPPAPTRSPVKETVDNLAGRVGAEVAYQLHYWLGAGSLAALLFLSFAAVILMLGGKVRDLPWRVVGLVLLVVTTAGAVYMANPDAGADVYRGWAGVLGINVGQFLLEKFAFAGWLILGVAFCIGLMFVADNLVLSLPRLGKRVGKKVWDKRGEIPTMAGAISAIRAMRAIRPKSTKGTDKSQVRSAASRPVARISPPAQRPEVPKPVITQASQIVAKLKSRIAPKPAPKPVAKPAPRPSEPGNYELPSQELLAAPTGGYIESQQEAAALRRDVLQQTLNDFNVSAEVIGYMTGPVITMYEVSVAPGVKVSQIANLAMDIARALAVPGVRIVPPRFGKDTIGIEVPNMDKEIVRIRQLMELRPECEGKMFLPLYLGKDAAGDAIVADLASMPHLLIAGTTGSGKSVCINTILMSLLMTRSPEEVKLILVDPKMVEMAAFENIPHLLCPIVNDMRKAEDILEWAAIKMDERYEILRDAGVRNLAQYNRLKPEVLYERLGVETDEEKARIQVRMPHFVIIIDELADLMMTSSKEVETHIIRIAQKARAVGIHLVLATQRPSVNVVTGLIKSNMPCRISFRVASRQESRIVLDQNGAEVLLGRGDMLLLQPGDSNLIRSQGAFVDDTEILPVVKQLCENGQQVFNPELVRLQSRGPGDLSGERDELFDKAVEVVLASQRGSVSLLQRRLQIGYSRASRIIDQMAESGLLGEYKGSQARECMMTLDEWQELQGSIAADQSGQASLDGAPTSA